MLNQYPVPDRLETPQGLGRGVILPPRTKIPALRFCIRCGEAVTIATNGEHVRAWCPPCTLDFLHLPFETEFHRRGPITIPLVALSPGPHWRRYHKPHHTGFGFECVYCGRGLRRNRKTGEVHSLCSICLRMAKATYNAMMREARKILGPNPDFTLSIFITTLKWADWLDPQADPSQYNGTNLLETFCRYCRTPQVTPRPPAPEPEPPKPALEAWRFGESF